MSFSEFGMSEWLIGCAFVLFIIVLVDGFRRMRAERRQEIKWDLQLSRDLPDDSEGENYNDELLDNYRVVDRTVGDSTAGDHVEAGAFVGRGNNFVGDVALDEHSSGQRSRAIPSDGQEELFASVEAGGQMTEGRWGDEEPGRVTDTGSPGEIRADEQIQAEATFASTEMQLIVLHVKARNAHGFSGSDIVQVLVACNMRYGENQILHRYVDTNLNSGPVEFSCANMVEPGTFDLDNLSDFRTPGVTFFMALPGSAADPLKSFNTMIETADCVVKTLNGVLLDEEHSTANLQVINHYRDRVKALSVSFSEA